MGYFRLQNIGGTLSSEDQEPVLLPDNLELVLRQIFKLFIQKQFLLTSEAPCCGAGGRKMAYIKRFTVLCDYCKKSQIEIKAQSEQQAESNITVHGWSLVGGHCCPHCQKNEPSLRRTYISDGGM